MKIDKSIWLLEMEKKINEIRTRITKLDINLLELDQLLRIAFILDNELIDDSDREALKHKFKTYVDSTEWISIHNPKYIHKGLRTRRLEYISPIRQYIFQKLKYNGYQTYRYDYSIWVSIFCILMHICNYFKLFYWDIIASIIVCLSAFILGYISDKKRIKKGRVF